MHAIECDKSFTRSDALAKHMRIQHNILPPLPGRGGNRKRKRDEADSHQANDGYSTFKVSNGDHHSSHADGLGDLDDGRISPFDTHYDTHNLLYPNGFNRRSPSPDDESDEDDGIPAHLLAVMDPATGLIMGRTPAMVKYVLMKAKYQYALQEHENLIEELRTLKYEYKCWRERKDALLDEVLSVTFG